MVHSLGLHVERNKRLCLEILLEYRIAKFYFLKYFDVKLYIHVYRHSVHRRWRTILREGECNIPTIIPSLINAYVDILCGYGQIDVYA
jgi:hypothetical protein